MSKQCENPRCESWGCAKHDKPTEGVSDTSIVAEGKHVYMGLCPDDLTGPYSRDPDCPVCQALNRLSQAETKLAKFDALARRYHNGYDPQMRKDLGMKEPESPLQALEEVLDEKHDIDTAGWRARLIQAEAELEELRKEVAALLEEYDEVRDINLLVSELKKALRKGANSSDAIDSANLLKWVISESIIVESALPRRKSGYDCGKWVNTRKYGRIFEVWGHGETEEAALKNAWKKHV